MVQVNRITGGSDEFISLIRGIQARVSTLETRSTGSMYVSGQIVTQDPVTGVETIFGTLPDGSQGFQEWVNDTEPPNAPSSPTVVGDRAIFEITWDGKDKDGFNQPNDYERTVVQMSTSNTTPVWVEVNYFTAAGRVVIGGQPYGEARYFRLISYDKNGNASAPSGTVSATLVSPMESPEMTTWINGVEQDITTAENAAVDAQNSASNAQSSADAAKIAAEQAVAQAVNAVPDPSFEDRALGAIGTGGWVVTTDTSRTGTKSVARVGATGTADIKVASEVPVAVGQTWEFSAWTKTTADYNGTASWSKLRVYTDGGTFATAVTWPVSVDWVKTTARYTIPSDGTVSHVYVQLCADNTAGTIWADDIEAKNITDYLTLEKAAADAQKTADAAAEDARVAAEAAGNAQDAANGKSTVWYQDTPPAGTAHKRGDTWFDTANQNKPMVWDEVGLVWVSARDGAIADVDSRVNTVVESVNGKNKNTTSTDPAPATYDGVAGDIWWQKSTTAPNPIIKQSRYNGTGWTEESFSHQTIASVDLGKATVGELDGQYISANTVTADKIIVGSAGNLIPGANFEVPTAWASPEWIDTGGLGKTGGRSMLVPAGTTQRGSYLGLANTNFRIKVTPGTPYRLSAWVYTDQLAPGDGVAVYARAYNSNGSSSYVFSSPSPAANRMTMNLPAGESTDIPANTWKLVSGIAVVPEGYDQLVIGLYVQGWYTGSARFSDVSVQQAVGTTLIEPGSITVDSGIIGSLDAGKITAGELDGIRIKAGTILTDRLVVGSGDNLIANPEFSSDTALTDARVSGATAGAVWSTPDYIGWNKTTASATVHSLKLGGQASDVAKPVTPVISNRRYKVGWTVFADAITSTSTRASYTWLNRDGTTTTTVGADKALTAVGVTSYEDEVVAPAEATHVALTLEFTQHPGGGWLDFRQPSMQLMTDGTVITKDAILTEHIMAGNITGDVLDMSYIKGQVVVSDMFEGGKFSGGIFQNATFETSPLANTGVKMSPTLGLIGYDTNQQTVFQVDPNGNATFTGTVTVTESSVIPQNAVTNLSSTLTTHGQAVDTVEQWRHPDNTTLINGGSIATDSITANQIALGAGQNFVKGGDGGDRTGWDDFGHMETSAGWPSDIKSLYTLVGKKIAYGPAFKVSGLNKYSFSYSYASAGPNIYHEAAVVFYDVNGAYISIMRLGRKSSEYEWALGSASASDQRAPTNAVTAKVYVENNWLQGDVEGGTQFGGFRLTTGAQTQLTSSGMTSYNAGVQTLRLNGEDNLLIGEVLTGRPGIEPYIKLSSRTNVAAIDFYSVEDPSVTVDQTNHGAVWWQVPIEVGQEYGQLRLYAIDDEPVLTGGRRFAAGMDIHSSGYLEFHGSLTVKSETFKGGNITFNSEFGANASGTYDFVYPTAFPSTDAFNNISVQLTCVSSTGAALLGVVTARATTGFSYKIFNLSNFGSGATRMAWTATRVSIN